MKKIIRTPGIVAVLLVMLFACNEDFLNRPGQGSLDANVLANQDGVEANLIAAYSLLDGWGNYGDWGGNASNWIFGSVTSDNAYKGSEPGDQQPIQDIELYQWSTGGTDGYLNSKWTVNYDGVNRANAAIILMGEVEGISDADQKRIEGEAVFLRAHYHFELWKMFKNIPYYTEADEDFKKTNVGTDALPLIIADLDAAINLLPEEQAQVGRATKWTAKALKGRVQMYQGDYTGALATLRDVVDNGPFMLEENFHDVFDVAHNNGPETILAYQASVNDGNPNGENGNRNDRLNFPHSGAPVGQCCGFHQPSQNLVNVFKVDANGLPFLDGSWNDADLTADDPVDPRLDFTAGRDDVPFLDWGLHEPGWIRDRAWAGPYSPKKNIYTQESGAWSAVGWQTMQLHSLNLHLLRYADVMLLLAEAEVRVGTPENARLLVNEIRERAAKGAQGPDGGPVVVPIDDAGITWATYDVKPYPAGGWDAIALDAVKMERRLELAMEGHRFFDLVRWGDFKQVLNDYIAVESTKRAYLSVAFPVEDRHAAYPLPSVQMELSKVGGESMLIQNPGW